MNIGSYLLMVLPQDKISKRKTQIKLFFVILLNYTLCSINLSVADSPYRVDADNSIVSSVPKNNPAAPAPIDSKYDEWFYVSATSNHEE